MELAEMLAIRPQEYLKDGFYDEDGEIREGINGYNSLAMAYRLREEKISPEDVKAVADQIDALAQQQSEAVDEDPMLAIDKASLESLDKIFKRKEAVGSQTLTDIYAAAKPKLKSWRDYAALAMHIDRILSQYALMLHLPKDDTE